MSRFLNQLTDPFGTAVVTAPDEEEQRRRRRVLPSADAGKGHSNGGLGRGQFLASLAQMGPLIAQIFQSTATRDSIQRALSDYDSMQERFRESQRLRADETERRRVAIEEAAKDREQRQRERGEDQAFRREMFDAEQEAADARFDRRTQLDAGARDEERSYREAISRADRADEFRQSMTGALRFGAAPPEQVQVWAAEIERTGRTPVEAVEAQARAQKAEDAAREAYQMRLREGRQPTEAEARKAHADALYGALLAEYKAIPDVMLGSTTPEQFMRSKLGDAGFAQMDASRWGYDYTPPPQPSNAEVAQRVLSDPNNPDRRRFVAALDSMTPGQFDAEVSQLLREAPDRDALLTTLEQAVTDPEHKAVLRRLKGQRPTRGSNMLDIAGEAIRQTGSDIGGLFARDPILGGPGRAVGRLIDWLGEEQ